MQKGTASRVMELVVDQMAAPVPEFMDGSLYILQRKKKQLKEIS
jgi:hypothetical protein